MATSVNSGQAALMQLPSVPHPKKTPNKKTLQSCVLPSSIQEERKILKTTASGGIDVYKVSKVSVDVSKSFRLDFTAVKAGEKLQCRAQHFALLPFCHSLLTLNALEWQTASPTPSLFARPQVSVYDNESYQIDQRSLQICLATNPRSHSQRD
jgi:hypothetical protein